MEKEGIGYACDLLKSLGIGIKKVSEGSKAEDEYLKEKVTKLYVLLVGEIPTLLLHDMKGGDR